MCHFVCSGYLGHFPFAIAETLILATWTQAFLMSPVCFCRSIFYAVLSNHKEEFCCNGQTWGGIGSGLIKRQLTRYLRVVQDGCVCGEVGIQIPWALSDFTACLCAFMKAVEELEMCQMGRKKNGFAWKANLGTTLSVEPTQTERCCVRTVQGAQKNPQPDQLGTIGKQECSKLRDKFKVITSMDARQIQQQGSLSSLH